MQQVQEWHDVNKETFHEEIVALNRPAILKSLVRDWPAVQQANNSPAAFTTYMNQFDAGNEMPVFIGSPAINGRFFYRDDLKGFNFDSKSRTLMSTLQALGELAEIKNPPAIAMQSVSVTDNLPGFCNDNHLALVGESVLPLIWIGNNTMTTTHYDKKENIACAVAGHRRITLFPPDQIANLYIGPLLYSPAGAPVSMVDLRQPDFSRYPKFKDALNVALQAELEPGDAIYIPSYWWHNVESLDSLSVLVNYWWAASEWADDRPYQSLLQSLLSIPNLPLHQRKIWRDLFDYYVFQIDQNPAAHLPADLQDIIGTFSPERKKRLIEQLVEQLGADNSRKTK